MPLRVAIPWMLEVSTKVVKVERKEERVKVKERMERVLKDIPKVVGRAKVQTRTSATSVADPDIGPMNAGTKTRAGTKARRIGQGKVAERPVERRKARERPKEPTVSSMQMRAMTMKNPNKNQKQRQGFFNWRH